MLPHQNVCSESGLRASKVPIRLLSDVVLHNSERSHVYRANCELSSKPHKHVLQVPGGRSRELTWHSVWLLLHQAWHN